jgi:hypothetical protein
MHGSLREYKRVIESPDVKTNRISFDQGQTFDGDNVNAFDRPSGMMAVQTDLAASTRTRKTRPTSCHRKPARGSGRPAGTGSASSAVSSQTSSTVSVQTSVAGAAQTSLATEIKAPVETASTTGTGFETATSTAQSLQEQPTTAVESPEAQPQSPTAAATSLTAPKATQAPSGGVGGPDRSKSEDWLKAHNDERAKCGQSQSTGGKSLIKSIGLTSSVCRRRTDHLEHRDGLCRSSLGSPLYLGSFVSPPLSLPGIPERYHSSTCPLLCRQGIYGENIAASIAADTDPVRTATGLWIGEAADYDYDNPVGGGSPSGRGTSCLMTSC